MRHAVLGVFLGLFLAGIGVIWWQGRAQVEANAPPPLTDLAPPGPGVEELITIDPNDMIGPDPPEASELTKEEVRFFRYDRNRDRIITRNEMLASRTAGFRALDIDGNNLLTFEEWAVATVNRFEGADADQNQQLTPAEFSTTAPKRRSRPSCRC